MKLCVIYVLLLGLSLISAQSAPDLEIREGSNATIPCENEGRVTWSKRINRTRKIIFQDPPQEFPVQSEADPRFVLLSDLTLVIQNVSVSDSGFYFCNTTAVVELKVVRFSGVSDGMKGSAATLTGGLYGVERGLLMSLAALFLSSLQ